MDNYTIAMIILDILWILGLIVAFIILVWIARLLIKNKNANQNTDALELQKAPEENRK